MVEHSHQTVQPRHLCPFLLKKRVQTNKKALQAQNHFHLGKKIVYVTNWKKRVALKKMWKKTHWKAHQDAKKWTNLIWKAATTLPMFPFPMPNIFSDTQWSPATGSLEKRGRTKLWFQTLNRVSNASIHMSPQGPPPADRTIWELWWDAF